MPSVIIAVPTLLGGPTLSSCLQALHRQCFRDFEVIVVNNGAAATGVEAQLFDFPLRILTPGSNVGFGAAVNLACRDSRAGMIATLNDDTEPDERWLQCLVAAMEADPQVGMCASRIEIHGTGTLDSSGMLVCRDGSSKQRGQSQPGRNWLEPGEALLPSGCAALYRRELLDDVGLFDEDFFLYCEDTDLGLRALWAGWHCRYVADAVVQHHYSRTAGAFSPLKAKFVERNRLWVAIKNFPASWLMLVPFASVVRYFWQLSAIRNQRGAASGFVRSGNSMGNIVTILAAAWWETLVSFPDLLRKRTRCRQSHRIPRSEFCRTISRHRISLKDLAYSG